jgi:hypothetical protein
VRFATLGGAAPACAVTLFGVGIEPAITAPSSSSRRLEIRA